MIEGAADGEQRTVAADGSPEKSRPEESTVTSSVNDCGEVPVLTTLSWLVEVVVCADKSVVTPLKSRSAPKTACRCRARARSSR